LLSDASVGFLANYILSDETLNTSGYREELMYTVGEGGSLVPWLTNDDLRALVAELVGTFIFVFLGAGSIITAQYINAPSATGLLIAAFGNGLGLGLAITIVGHISGGHLNPAVTIALWVSQRITSVLALLYIVFQLAGATLAGLLLSHVFGSGYWGPVHLGAPHLASNVDFGTAVLIEAILTFFLVMAVFGTAVDPRHAQVGGFGIGLIVMLDVLVGGPLTGAAMNPARAFGPMLAGNFWNNEVVFWVGPILGAIVASLIYGYILMPHEDLATDTAVQGAPNYTFPHTSVETPDPASAGVVEATVVAAHVEIEESDK
jgi:MIP family channel proteins